MALIWLTKIVVFGATENSADLQAAGQQLAKNNSGQQDRYYHKNQKHDGLLLYFFKLYHNFAQQ